MNRSLLASLCFLLASFSPALRAQDASKSKEEEAKKLNIGDPAPALKVTKWLQGSEVKSFDKDKVYVVEFWATWCGPCIRAMPHLNQLHEEYKSKGLVVIGLSSKDPNNSQEKVEEFVKKNGNKFTYTFAYAEDRATSEAYMDASGQRGIPCSFVIDKAGKVAFIGHPMELDDVLPKVLDGSWKGKADIEAIQAANKELQGILRSSEANAEKAYNDFVAFEKKYPTKMKQEMVGVQKMVVTMRAKKYDDAKVQGEAMIAKSIAKKSASPAAYVGMIFADKELNPEKKHLDLAIKGLEIGLQFEQKDIGLMIGAVDVYLASGNRAKAEEYAKKAVDAADDENTKKQVQRILDARLKAAEAKEEKKN